MLIRTTSVLCAIAAMAGMTFGLTNEVPYASCEDMKAKGPGHRYAAPQKSKIPYEFHFQDKTILNTQTMDFTIRQKDGGKPFQGFMVQAREDKSEFPLKPIGTFFPKDENSRTVTCTDSYDTASHNSPDDKTSVTLTWTPPPEYQGKVTFYVTVAETQYIYWSQHKAGVVTVSKPDD